MFNFYPFDTRLIDKRFHPKKLNLIPSTIVLKFLQKTLFEFTRSISRINNILLHKIRGEDKLWA